MNKAKTKLKFRHLQHAIPSGFFPPKLIEQPFILSSQAKSDVILLSPLPHPNIISYASILL